MGTRPRLERVSLARRRGEGRGELGVSSPCRLQPLRLSPPPRRGSPPARLCAPRRSEFFLGRGARVLKPERVPVGRLAGRAGNGGTLSFRRL